MRLCTLFVHFLIICNASIAYKPVVLLHGIMTGNESMALIKERIIEKHPGTIVYNTDRFAGWSSLENMWYQVLELGKDLMNITKQHPEGVNFIGYSQGALLARVILQTFPEHNVHNRVPQRPAGRQYGSNRISPHNLPGIALKAAFELFYSRVGQHTSVGNYWNDPYHQDLYYTFSQFLPFVNNDIRTNRSEQFKAGLVKLNKMVLVGGPDDNVITPWQSSQFGYYDVNETVILLPKRDIYTKDLIGLRTLDERKKLDVVTVPGVNHFMWHLNMSILDNYILKYLD